MALFSKGYAQSLNGNAEEAIDAYDKVVRRYGDSPRPELQVGVAWTLISKGDIRKKANNSLEARVAYEEVVKRYSKSSSSDVQAVVNVAKERILQLPT